jgi:hypothetical protein
VWFSWTAPATGTATLSLCGGTAMDSKIAAYPGSGCPIPGSALACNDDFCGLQSQIAFPVLAGSTYTLQLGCSPGATGSAGTFTLSIASTPPNDDCSAATVVAGAGPFPFDNNGATTGTQGQSELFCNYQGATGIDSDVWFTWTASLTGTYAASLCGGTSIDTKLGVYDGAGCPAGTSIGCNDDACSLQSEVLFAAQAGASYTFQIGSHPGTGQGSGTWTITFRGAGPANDDPCVTPVALPGTTTGYTVNSTTATTTKPQTVSPCYDNVLAQDVWYTWTPPATDTYTFSLCGSGTSGFTPGINIYQDAPPACPGPQIRCGSGCGGSEVCFSATVGQTYWVQIGTAVGAQGTNPLSLSITEGPCSTGTPNCDPGVGGTMFCPCSNPPSAPGRGCNNSSNTGGASISATGSSSLSSDTVVFTTANEKPTALSIVLQGSAVNTTGIVFGQGIRCVAGVLKRLYVKVASGGSITAPSGSDPTVSARSASLGDPIGAGQQRYYLVYYRDPIVLGGCSATATFNATNGWVLLWLP